MIILIYIFDERFVRGLLESERFCCYEIIFVIKELRGLGYGLGGVDYGFIYGGVLVW